MYSTFYHAMMAQALNRIVAELSNRKEPLTVLTQEESVIFALAEAYADAIQSTVMKNLLKQLKEHKIYQYGRAREDLVNVASRIRVMMQTRGSASLPVVSDKEVQP